MTLKKCLRRKRNSKKKVCVHSSYSEGDETHLKLIMRALHVLGEELTFRVSRTRWQFMYVYNQVGMVI